jgi:Zn-finger nucleic acid-binding protein
MEKVEYHSIVVDRCTQCKGIWFDMLEAEILKEIDGSEQIDIGSRTDGAIFNEVENIKCPKCNTVMGKMVDNDQPHIWYESCDICYGIFFDAGEFRDYKEESVLDFFKDIFSKPRQ